MAAFLLAFKGIQNLANSDGPLTFSDIFTNPIFRNIVISLLATLGLYIIASVIFVSFLQLVNAGFDLTAQFPSSSLGI